METILLLDFFQLHRQKEDIWHILISVYITFSNMRLEFTHYNKNYQSVYKHEAVQLALLVQPETSCLTWKILLHFWIKNEFKILLSRTLSTLPNLIFKNSAHTSKSVYTSMLKYSSSHFFITKTILCLRSMACKSIFKTQKTSCMCLISLLTHLQHMFCSCTQFYVLYTLHTSWNFSIPKNSI